MKSIINKIAVFILISIFVLSLASCAKTNPAVSTTQEPLQSADPVSGNGQVSQTNQEQANTSETSNNSNAGAGNTTPGNGSNKNTGADYSAQNGNTSNNPSGSAQNSTQNTPEPPEITTAPGQITTAPEVPKKTITIAIYGPMNSTDKTIVAKSRINYTEGMSVFDALKEITKQNNIEIQTTGLLPGTEYVKGIGDFYQFDEGPGSGWLYAVNGIPAGISCGSYKLKDGDDIEWRYSLNLGKDIGWNLR